MNENDKLLYIIKSLKNWEEEDSTLNKSFDVEDYDDLKGTDAIDWDFSLSKDGMKLIVISPDKLFFFSNTNEIKRENAKYTFPNTITNIEYNYCWDEKSKYFIFETESTFYLFSSDGELIKTFDISDLKFKTIPNIIIGIGMSYTTCPGKQCLRVVLLTSKYEIFVFHITLTSSSYELHIINNSRNPFIFSDKINSISCFQYNSELSLIHIGGILFNTNTSKEEEIIICFTMKEDENIEEIYTINNKIHKKEDDEDEKLVDNKEIIENKAWYQNIYNKIITFIFSYFSAYNIFERSIISMDYNKDNNQLLVLNNNSEIFIWNIEDGTFISSLNDDNNKIIQSVYWNNSIIINYEDGLINIYDNKLQYLLNTNEKEYIQMPLRIRSSEDKVFILLNSPNNNNNMIELKYLSKCTPNKLLQYYIENKAYGNALTLCDEYNLKKDMIYKQQWLDYIFYHNTNPYHNINEYKSMLNMIDDNIWIISQLMTIFSNDSSDDEYDALQFGIKKCKEVLHISEKEEVENDKIISMIDVVFNKDESSINIFIYMLLLLKYNQYHEIYKEYIKITHSEYDSIYFQQLLSMKMKNWANDQAKRGNYEMIIFLFAKYNSLLLPYKLEILNNITSIVSPSLYKEILPVLEETDNNNDDEWFNRKENINYIINKLKSKNLFDIYRDKLELFYYYIIDEDSEVLLQKQNNRIEICEWYKNRINSIYSETNLLSYCYDLSKIFYVNIKDVKEEEEKKYIKYIKSINELYILNYEKDTLLSISLNNWLLLSVESKIQLLLEHSLINTIVSDIYNYIFPLIDLSLQYNIEDEYYNSLKEYIMKQSENKNYLPFILEIFKTSQKDSIISSRIIRTDEEVKDMLIEICLHTKESNQFRLIADVLDCINNKYSANEKILQLKCDIDTSILLSELYQIHIEIPKYQEWKDKYETNKNDNENVILITESNEYQIVYNMYKKAVSIKSLFEHVKLLHQFVFNYINVEVLYEIIINQLLLDNKFSHVRDYSYLISQNKLIKLIIKTSKMIYTSASSCTSPELDKSLQCLELIENNEYEEIEKEKNFIFALKMIPMFKVEILPAEVILYSDKKIKIIENILKNNPQAYIIDSNYMPGHHLLEFANKLGITSRTELFEVKVMMLQSTMKNNDYQLSHQFCIELILSNEIKDKKMVKEREIIAEICYNLVKENNNTINFAGQLELIEFALTNGDSDVIEKSIDIYPNILLYSNISDLLKIPSIIKILPEYFQNIKNIKFQLPSDICNEIWESRNILEPLLENKRVNQLLVSIYSMLLNNNNNNNNKIDIYKILLKIQFPKDIAISHGIINEMICNTDLLNYDEIINQFEDLNYIKCLYNLLLMSLTIYIMKSYNNEVNITEIIDNNDGTISQFDSIKTKIPKLIPYIELYQSLYEQYQSLLIPNIPDNNNTDSTSSPINQINSERYFNHCKSSLQKPNPFSSSKQYLKYLNSKQFSLFCNDLFSNDLVSKEIQIEFMNYFCQDDFINTLYNHLIEQSNEFNISVFIILYKLLLYKNYKINELLNTYRTILLIDYFPKYIQDKNEIIQQLQISDSCSVLFLNILENYNLENDVEKSKKLLNILMLWDNLNNRNVNTNLNELFNLLLPKDLNYDQNKDIITLTNISYQIISKTKSTEEINQKDLSKNENSWFIYLSKYHSILSNYFISLPLYYNYEIQSEESVIKLFNLINKSLTSYEYSFFILSFRTEDNILMILNHLSDYIEKNKTFLYENDFLIYTIISRVEISILLKCKTLYEAIKHIILEYMKEWIEQSRPNVPFLLSIPYLLMKLILCGFYVESIELYREYTGINSYFSDIAGIWQSMKLYLNRLLRIEDSVQPLSLGWEYVHSLVKITIERMGTIKF